VLLNPTVLVESGLSDVLGAIRQILLSYLVHMHGRLRSLGQGRVHVGPITWRFCHKKFMMIYFYHDSYIVIENCHKHDDIVCYDDFNDGSYIFVIIVSHLLMMNYFIVIDYSS
jgi:hypothetical protein